MAKRAGVSNSPGSFHALIPSVSEKPVYRKLRFPEEPFYVIK